MNIQAKSYQLPEKEFKEYLNDVRKNENTLTFFSFTPEPLYFYKDSEAFLTLIEAQKAQKDFEETYHFFSMFGQGQWLEKFLIDDIESTNLIEEIYSTRHDIFALLHNVSLKNNDEKIASLVQAYQWVLGGKAPRINTLEELRKCYDAFIGGAVAKSDMPDGKLFRKSPVFITNGIKPVHQGFYPEEKIEKGMQDFLKCYNGQEPLLLRVVLSHLLLEHIHPFYDGNGRFGRYLISAKIYEETQSPFALLFSSAFQRSKNKYYSSLASSSNPHQYGFMNQGFENLFHIVIEQTQNTLLIMKEKKKSMENWQIDGNWSAGQKKILQVLKEASLLSDFGISINEIITATGQSKRNVIYTLQKLKASAQLLETKIGRCIYRKITI